MLQDVLGVNPDDAALYFMIPQLCNLLVKLTVNPLLHKILRSWFGFDLLGAKRVFTALGFCGAAGCLAVVHLAWWTISGFCESKICTCGEGMGSKCAHLIPDSIYPLCRLCELGLPVFVVTALLTGYNAFVGLHPMGFKSNYFDLSLHNSGAISGMGNTVASM